jgi:predicted nuclease of restriction endonuclease-like (RecB) superfamily
MQLDMQAILKNYELFLSVEKLIRDNRQKVAISVNATMSMLYWQIGRTVGQEVLNEKRGDYGKRIVVSLARQLMEVYGDSYSEKNLRRMIQFASAFPDEQIVVSLIRQLSWTHIIALLPIQDPIKREFYVQMCVHEKWSVRVFRERIQSMLYERTAISKKPQEVIANDLKLLKNEQKLNPDLISKDPYFLDFLGLRDAYSEKDLEASIIVELQRFIIEMGSDFAFMARQKRITIDNRDYFIDLLFYHRRLKCLIIIDLKMGQFEIARHKMESQ